MSTSSPKPAPSARGPPDLIPLLVSVVNRVQLPLQHTPSATCLSTLCIGSGDIGQGLLSRCISIEPVVVELVRGLVTQGLMGAHRLVGVIPGHLGRPDQRGGPPLVELLLVGAEASLNASVTLRIVGPVEIVSQLEFCNRSSKLLQELASPVRLYDLNLALPRKRCSDSWPDQAY